MVEIACCKFQWSLITALLCIIKLYKCSNCLEAPIILPCNSCPQLHSKCRFPQTTFVWKSLRRLRGHCVFATQAHFKRTRVLSVISDLDKNPYHVHLEVTLPVTLNEHRGNLLKMVEPTWRKLHLKALKLTECPSLKCLQTTSSLYILLFCVLTLS